MENFRPIVILPILYKVFSKLLCSRVSSFLVKAQSVDQAGFRPGFSCDDHIFVVTLLSEMFGEFRRPLWIIAVDFRKAFDSVSQPQLWHAMVKQGVPKAYVHFLMKLYDGQSGRIQTDCVSKRFEIKRGTRQGDPISPVLFNAALEELMGRLHGKWATKRKYGISMGDRKLTNLRFADDLLLCASSFTSSREMLEYLMAESKKLRSTSQKRSSCERGPAQPPKQRRQRYDNDNSRF